MNQADILKLTQFAKEAGLDTAMYGHEPVAKFAALCIEAGRQQEANESAASHAMDIALAVQHERAEAYKREQEIVRLACKAAADQARDLQKEIEAIRARSKS